MNLKIIGLVSALTMSMTVYGNTNKAEIAKLKEKIKEIEALSERVDDLEFQGYTRRFNVNGDMEINYESLNVNYDDKTKSDENINLIGLNTHLHFSFDVNDKIQFFSTLGMSKYFQVAGRKERYLTQDLDNDGDNDREAWEQSHMSSSGYEGPNAKFDRAYLNFFVTDKFTISAGRLPTQNGPPSEQFDGKERTGTLPRSARNSMYDGFAFTYDLKSLVKQENDLKVKFYYIPWQNVHKTNRAVQMTTPTTTTNDPGPNEKVDSNTLGTGFQVESFVRTSSLAKEIETHVFSVYYKDFWWNQYKQIYSGFTYTASVGFNQLLDSRFNLTFVLNGTEWWTADKPDDKIRGQGLLLNLNYKFESTDVVGLELLKTNDDHYADDFAYLSVTSMYSAKAASGGHLWWSTPLYDNLRLRSGFIQYNAGANSKTNYKSAYLKLLTEF